MIRYELPDDITLGLTSDVELSFRFGLHSPNISLPITEIKVQQTVDVLVKTEDPQPVDYFSSLAFKLCNFLTLALDQAVSIQSMTGYVDQENAGGQNHRRPVKVIRPVRSQTRKRAYDTLAPRSLSISGCCQAVRCHDCQVVRGLRNLQTRIQSLFCCAGGAFAVHGDEDTMARSIA